MKIGILLINLGTPRSPRPRHVARYLFSFLNDRRVIDIHPIARFFLVNFIIVPFRSFRSARLYSRVWTPEGSPLLLHSIGLKEKLQKKLGTRYVVELGMRYGKPSISEALQRLQKNAPSQIHILPLYPQYSGSGNGSAIEEAMRVLSKWEMIPSLALTSRFFDHPAFIRAWTARAKEFDPEAYDHVLFSYHGLPESQIRKASDQHSIGCQLGSCCDQVNSKNEYCYRAGCAETTRLIAGALRIPRHKYSMSFQSRLDNKWLKPYSDKVIAEFPEKGIKKLLVFSPAFVADCLETIYEIGIEYEEIFTRAGGIKFDWVRSLNDQDEWVQGICEIIGTHAKTETVTMIRATPVKQEEEAD
jgi:ferrochelatase